VSDPAEIGPSKRLFFASWPTDERRAELDQRLCRVAWASSGRRVAAANYHLTLAFLGAVPSTRLAAVSDAGARLRAAAFDLRLDRIEHWPKPQVLCLVASSVPDAAQMLVRTLWRVLAGLGFKPEVRPFKAHLTLIRKVQRPPADCAIDALDWRVDSVALVESVTAPDGPAYMPLAFWPLSSSST
jgi:RNA 2',3'-cyclic 3'-phosphodiesterase